MHMTRRAPELSATSSSLDIWIMESRLPFGFARYVTRAADDFPALQLGNRLALADAHEVADLVGLGFVVGVIFLRPPHSLSHHRMDEAALHLAHYGLGVRIAHNH